MYCFFSVLLTSACRPEATTPLPLPTTQTVSAGDTELHLVRMGTGPALLFIHGGPGMSHHYFRPYMDSLAADHEVIYYDQRLSGLSAPECDTNKISLSQWTEDLDLVRQAVNRDSIILISHSWGARVAIRYAEKYPEHVAGIIFMNPVGLTPELVQEAVATFQGRITAADRQQQEALSSSQALLRKEPAAIKEAYLLTFAQNMYDRSNLDHLNIYIPDRLLLRNQMMGRLYQDPQISIYNDYNLLHSITSPALIIHGSYDASPISGAERMVEKLQHAELKVIEKSGHFSFIEQPDSVQQEILLFLKKIEQPVQ